MHPFLWLSNIPMCLCTTTSLSFICRWTSRLLPCSSYCKSCCKEQRDTCVFFNPDFLKVLFFFFWAAWAVYIVVLYCCLYCMSLSHVRLYWNPMDCNPSGSSVRGIFQATILEWVAVSSFRGSSQPRDQTHVSCIFCIDRWSLYHWTTWNSEMFLYLRG